MADFLEKMKDLARANKKTIVLPEGEDTRTIEAAKAIIADGTAELVILGNPKEISIPGATVINPAQAEKHDAYAEELARLRSRKGMTFPEAKELMDDATYFGTMMVKMGDADGLVSGACHSTANTLRPALQILKTKPETKIVSGFMVMCVPDCDYGQAGTFIFADVGLNEYPNSEQLAEIAISSAHSWQALMQTEPYIAMLSYSTHGSAKSEHVEKVTRAFEYVQERAPELNCDGDLQLDAALDEVVCQIKAPTSSVGGKANVLIFPNLDAGNIGYKLVQRLGKAQAYGPLLQGIAKPVNDLSRGCSAKDIEAVVAITAVQAALDE